MFDRDCFCNVEKIMFSYNVTFVFYRSNINITPKYNNADISSSSLAAMVNYITEHQIIVFIIVLTLINLYDLWNCFWFSSFSLFLICQFHSIILNVLFFFNPSSCILTLAFRKKTKKAT